MFCHKCGTQLPDDAAFCPKCGVELDAGNANLKPDAVQEDLPKEEKPSPLVIIGAIIVLIAMAVVVFKPIYY